MNSEIKINLISNSLIKKLVIKLINILSLKITNVNRKLLHLYLKIWYLI